MLDHLRRAPDEVVAERRRICNSCEHRVPAAALKLATCGKCGCVLAVKTAFKTQSCPLKKW